eukprot:5999854-Prymnesium_polylepis.1
MCIRDSDSLVGLRVRCLTKHLTWAKATIVGCTGPPTSRKHTVRYDKVKREVCAAPRARLADGATLSESKRAWPHCWACAPRAIG